MKHLVYIVASLIFLGFIIMFVGIIIQNNWVLWPGIVIFLLGQVIKGSVKRMSVKA